MTIKIMAKQRAYFNGAIIKPGTIINFKGDTVPSWAKAVSKQNKPETKQDNTAETKPENAAEQQTLIPEENGEEENTDLPNKTEEELNKILDDLITKALDIGVYLDNTEGKSVTEQITELQAAIEKGN